MASDPIPDPLTNQEVRAEAEPTFPAAKRPRPELVEPVAPPISADRELPRAPRREEIKGAVQEKIEQIKQASYRVTATTAQALQDVKEQTATAFSRTKERAGDMYQESRIHTSEALRRARSRVSYVMDEYPLHVIAGVAAVAFVCGILLRVWRSSRDA